MYRNSKSQGDYGLGQAIAYYTKLGWTVSLPLTDSQPYDMIVDDGTGPKTVQVKTSSTNKFELRTLGGNQSWSGVAKRLDRSRVDILFACHTDGRFWVVDTNRFGHINSINTNTLAGLTPDGNGSGL